MEGMLKKRYLNVPIGIWIPLVCIPLIFYSIYCYSDIIWTTKNGLTVWYLLFEGKNIGEFYATPYPLDSNVQHAYYDFFIYVIFAIWDIPLFIYEKITGISFMHNYIALWYAKSIIFPFFFLCAIQIYKLAYKVTNDKEKSCWSVFTFIFSIMVLQTMVIMNGYEIISLLFTLCGLNAYIKKENKKFVLYFACAVACKMFALCIFIPLVLLRWKKVVNVLCLLFSSISFILIPKLYFVLYEMVSGKDTLIAGTDNTISSVVWIDEYLWSGEAPIAISSIPLFFFFTFMLWVVCWFNKKELTDRMLVYIPFLSMAIFFLTCETHPYWIILVAPYIAILECMNWENLSMKLFLESCSGIGYILLKIRRSAPCYSYNVVNNMLQFESDSSDFKYMGIWNIISKMSDITGINIDHLWTFFGSIFAASFVMLLVCLYPKQEEEITMPQCGNRYFYVKAFYSMLVLVIPLLGVFVRTIWY